MTRMMRFLLTLLIEEGSVHHRLMYVSTARKWLSIDTVLPEPVSGVGEATGSLRQFGAIWGVLEAAGSWCAGLGFVLGAMEAGAACGQEGWTRWRISCAEDGGGVQMAEARRWRCSADQGCVCGQGVAPLWWTGAVQNGGVCWAVRWPGEAERRRLKPRSAVHRAPCGAGVMNQGQLGWRCEARRPVVLRWLALLRVRWSHAPADLVLKEVCWPSGPCVAEPWRDGVRSVEAGVLLISGASMAGDGAWSWPVWSACDEGDQAAGSSGLDLLRWQ
ncbi:hypothetical protein Taro_018925 [Colocasia esculenta]|uniref:Uncharacterized protein n=1 Tax=Colocasia esculenta TaxID=4460 RepID=A0A843UJU3_COLES|nr:hypothetical protein [Colocasia esculenta]